MVSPPAYKGIVEFMQVFPDEKTCREFLERLRWNGKVTSPFDPSSKVYVRSNGRYKCQSTGKYFNVKTGSIFAATKLPLRTWFLGIYYLLANRKSCTKHWMAEQLSITPKTAWHLLQRLRRVMANDVFLKEMEKVVMVDETFCGGKNKNRHWDKKVEQARGRSFKDKTPVFGMMDSDGYVRCQVVNSTAGSTLKPLVKKWAKTGSVLVSDEWGGYNGLGKDYDHQIVDHKRKSYVNDQGFTTNAVEGFWSSIKRAWIGIHHYVSRKHLHRYVSEQVFKHNFRESSPPEQLGVFLQGVFGIRLRFRELVLEPRKK